MDHYVRLIYTSIMTQSSNNVVSMNDIISTSNSNNILKNIGGKLIWVQDESSIFQILEGKSEYINPLFKLIKNDSRHFNIVLLSITDITRSDIIYDTWIYNINPSNPSVVMESSIQSYHLSCIIGSGGTSTVVLGEHIYTKKRYAVKMINKRRMTNKNILRIITERDILSSSKHHFVQSLKSCLQDACHIYFITSFASRGDLYACAKDIKLTVENSLFYLYEIISGLRYLHMRDIIHNDMKLENVLVNSDGHIALTDFGVSFISSDGILPSQNDMDSSARGGAGFGVRVVGTPCYFAPEVINLMLKTKASDLWAVGVMLCEMLTDHLPWDGKSKKEMYKFILNSEVETLVETKDPNIISLLSVLCDHDYKTRFTCDDIIAKVLELDLIQNWDDVENKRIVPPHIPPETHPLRTTIVDFERLRISNNDNESEHEKYDIEDFNTEKVVKCPECRRE